MDGNVYAFILNPPGYLWYYTPLALSFSLGSALFLEGLAQRYGGIKKYFDICLLCVLAACLSLAALVLPYKMAQAGFPGKYIAYKSAAFWLNQHAHKGESVGANEIGILGYFYKKGPVIDGLGLVTPGVAIHVAQRDYAWYVRYYKPDFLVFQRPPRPILEGMVATSWFREHYIVSKIIRTRGRSDVIYKRRK